MIANVKTFLERNERNFCGISIFENELTFLIKKLQCVEPLSCTPKLDNIYATFLILIEEIAQKWHM